MRGAAPADDQAGDRLADRRIRGATAFGGERAQAFG
jgi:hypothetical protein